MSAAPAAPAAPAVPAAFAPRIGLRRAVGAVFAGLCALSAALCVVALLVLLARVFIEGSARLDWNLVQNNVSRVNVAVSGVRPAIWGTIWLMGLTTLIAVPVGVGAAVYLEEYARKNWLSRLIQVNLSNLAGVPSIVYGILGMTLFITTLGLGNSVLAGALTLSLLVMPMIIIASREALVAVPPSIRQAAFALGATRWQTVRHHVLPAAMPGILTGIILAMSRAIGEAAPLVMIGAAAVIDTVPGENLGAAGYGASGMWQWLKDALLSSFAALPIQIYNFAGDAQAEIRALASATILILLAVLLSMNALAVGIRAWQQRHRRW